MYDSGVVSSLLKTGVSSEKSQRRYLKAGWCSGSTRRAWKAHSVAGSVVS